MLTSLLSISLGAILINNFIFSQFLGICPFLGCSNKMDTAAGMGLAVIFVMGLASALCWMINEWILMPLDLGFMQTVAYILVIASLVQFIEMFLKKSVPSLYSALGIYLPLITTNCCTWHLSAADHHQLRSPRCCASEHSEQLQLHRVRGLRHHRRYRIPGSYLPAGIRP